MRETGRQQEATQFKCKQKVMIYNFRETVSELEEFTHCRDIKASKVSRDASKGHVIPPWHAVWTMWTCGQCGGVDSRNTERPRQMAIGARQSSLEDARYDDHPGCPPTSRCIEFRSSSRL